MDSRAEQRWWEREFFETFGADKIWVEPSHENVETILRIWEFIGKEIAAERERVMARVESEIRKHGSYMDREDLINLIRAKL